MASFESLSEIQTLHSTFFFISATLKTQDLFCCIRTGPVCVNTGEMRDMSEGGGRQIVLLTGHAVVIY